MVAASAHSSCKPSASAGALNASPPPARSSGRRCRARPRAPRQTATPPTPPVRGRHSADRRSPSRKDTMTELHVIPDERTTWRIYEDGAGAPLSEHTNATDAEHAALVRADERGARRVVVHDRYHRTHDATRSRAELRARARSARARQLTLVRERARRLARPFTP